MNNIISRGSRVTPLLALATAPSSACFSVAEQKANIYSSLAFNKLTNESLLRSPTAVDDRMPMLDHFTRHVVPATHDDAAPLEDVDIVMIQHQMATHPAQVQSLLDLGADPTRIISIDTAYSASDIVKSRLRSLGLLPSNIHSHRYTLQDDYHEYQTSRVADVLADHAQRSSPATRTVVLDDGAYFLEASERLFPMLQPRMHTYSVVEQTARGLIKIRGSPRLSERLSEVSMVNVAEAQTKQLVEPPFISSNAVGFMMASLRELGVEGSTWVFDDKTQVAVTGYGVIGRNVALSVRGEYPCSVMVVEPDEKRRMKAVEDGFHAVAALPESGLEKPLDVVIGCSGSLSLHPVKHNACLSDRVLLVSASSGNHELGLNTLIAGVEGARCIDPSVLSDYKRIHDFVEFDVCGKHCVWTNGGFPQTFSGGLNSVPSRVIQSTNVMMVAAAIQAADLVKTGAPHGLVPLDGGWDEWIAANAAWFGRYDHVLDVSTQTKMASKAYC